MTTWAAAHRQYPTREEVGYCPPLPELVKVAFTFKRRRRKSNESQVAKEQRASKMEWTLMQLADGQWHTFERIDTPHYELMDRGFVEERKIGGQREYQITQAGLRLHRKIEKRLKPKPVPRKKCEGQAMRKVKPQPEDLKRQINALKSQQLLNEIIMWG